MKLIETIEDLNLQLDDPACQELSKKLKRKYTILGNCLFFGGLIISILAFIALIGISIYAIVTKTMIYWHMSFILIIFIFAILAVLGKYYQSISKEIIVKN